MTLILDETTALAVEKALEVLSEGGVIIYPTDTLYGIGCDGTSAKAVGRVHKIKGTERKKPLSVMMADLEMVKEYCELSHEQETEIQKKLPGPYTFLLKIKKGSEIPASGNAKKLGIRIPDNEFCQFLCKRFGKPIVTTSANITGQNPPVCLEDVDKRVLERADLAIDGGKTKYKRASEISDLVERKRVR
jgi:L-threonylcarbamoyladenylate synthase